MNKNQNQNFLEEIEKNSKIFAEKINILNSSYNNENLEQQKEFKKNRFIKKQNINKVDNYTKEYNYEENPITDKKINNKKINNKIFDKNYILDLNTIDAISKRKNNKNVDLVYYNTISNQNNFRKNNFQNDSNDDEEILENNNNKLIEELREVISQKTKFIKLLKSELKEKEKLPTQDDYDELNYNYENALNNLKTCQSRIKNKDDEIINLKMKLDSINAQNKNMKGVINKRESDMEKMKISVNNMKEELKTAKNKMDEAVINQNQTNRDYDILNKQYIELKSEKDKLNLDLVNQKRENFRLKNENNQLKKLIDKLKEEIKEIKSSKKKQIDEKMNSVEYKNNDISNEDQEKIIIHNIKKNTKNKLNVRKNESINKVNEKNNKNNGYDDTEEKIIYNNDDDDDSDEEENINKEQIKNKIKVNKDINIKKNLEKTSFSNKENEAYKDENNIKIEKKINSKEKEKNKEFISLIKYKDKIIGCNREKIKLLIKEKEYQTIDKEVHILTKEKEKLENELLKMPERPRKLNDIKNKKEINDSINKIENDIKYIRTLLKNSENYYIN